MKTILFTCCTKSYGAVQTPGVEAWETPAPEFADQLLVIRRLESLCKLAMANLKESFFITSAKLSHDAEGRKVVFGEGLYFSGDLGDAELLQLRIACLQTLRKLRQSDPVNDALFKKEALNVPAFPNEQMLIYRGMVDQLSGKTLSSPIFIRVPEFGDFHLSGQILPARDRPVKNFPNRFLGLTVSTNVKARSARIEVHRDLEGNDQDEGTLTAKIASQEVWEKLCDAAKHSEPMQFEVQGTPKDDGTGRVDYEMQSISDVLPGDGAPLIPAV